MTADERPARPPVPGDLTPVRESHRLDESALVAYLHQHLPGFRGPLTVLQFEGGQSNPTYLLRAASGDLVLRKKPPGRLLPSAHQVEREYRVLTALQESGVPVPPTHLACQDDSVIGTPFFVMGCVPGRVFRSPRLPALAPDDRRALYADMVAVLARLHSVEVRAAGLADFGRTGNYFERQIARWSQQYLAAKTDEIAAMDRLMTWLPAHVPAGDETAIVHGDYRVENVIVHPTAPRIVAVVDWELSTLGHPLADLAYNCLSYHLEPGLLGPAETEGDWSGIPDEAEHVAAYCRLTGRTGIPDWPFYLAFSLFRLASILQGVYARGLQGNAASARALERGAAARKIAERAWELASR
jgi:aminoglycoside phosphotransferase (APT) family kinase protein